MKNTNFLLVFLAATHLSVQIPKVPPTTKWTCPTTSCQISNTINITTGVDAHTGVKLPIGAIDPSWGLLNSPPLTVKPLHEISIPNACVISAYEASWNEIPGAGILSSIPEPSFYGNNVDVEQPWRFSISFGLCEKTTIKISGKMRADDYGALCLYNAVGDLLYQTDTSKTDAYKVDKEIEQILDLPAGAYSLEFRLINSKGNACGFALKGQISTVDESEVLFKETGFTPS